MTSPTQSVTEKSRWPVWFASLGALIVLGIVAEWNQLIAFVVRIVPYDAGVREGLFSATPTNVGRTLLWNCLLLVVIATAAVAVIRQWPRLRDSRIQAKLLTFGSTLSCSAYVFMLLYKVSYEGDWYPIDQIMSAPASMGIYGRRLLFIWLAQALKHLVPGLSSKYCFLLVQACVILLTLIVIGQWSRHFVGDLAYMGQILFVVIIAPTFGYFNSYDIGIVFFYTLAFLLLLNRRYLLFALVVGAGTLNHENTLLLVPTAAAVCIGRERLLTTVKVAGGSFGAWLAVRLLIAVLMPANSGYDLRFFTNPWILYHPNRPLVESAMMLTLWIVLFAVGFPHASTFLRRLAVLGIPLLCVTYLFGKFHEFRQFDAFIPVLIGVALSHIRYLAGRLRMRNTAEYVPESIPLT